MALLAVAMKDSPLASNPLIVLPAMMKAPVIWHHRSFPVGRFGSFRWETCYPAAPARNDVHQEYVHLLSERRNQMRVGVGLRLTSSASPCASWASSTTPPNKSSAGSVISGCGLWLWNEFHPRTMIPLPLRRTACAGLSQWQSSHRDRDKVPLLPGEKAGMRGRKLDYRFRVFNVRRSAFSVRCSLIPFTHSDHHSASSAATETEFRRLISPFDRPCHRRQFQNPLTRSSFFHLLSNVAIRFDNAG